jgi:uncharacterized caspase-like protein
MNRSAETQWVGLLSVALIALLGQVAVAQNTPVGTRRAVIVGISKYVKLSPAKQLRYAAADARLVDEFFRSRAGGSVAPDNIRLLEDSSARAGRINEALRWLRQQSKSGDEAIIYFAGQSDAELWTGDQNGFLLATDADSGNYIDGGALEVGHLQGLAAAMAGQGVRVLVIIDACRAGKLMSGEGARQTMSALVQSWSGVTKLVSSRPDQASSEGEQWGGGHGVFTYFLVAGLEGLADLDHDGVVTLGEAMLYVSDKVKKATNGAQAPVWSGDPQFPMAFVDTAALRAARARVEHQ